MNTHFKHSPLNNRQAAAAKSLQSCPTLCDPTDGSPPGSSVHGIFQARVLERGALPSPNNRHKIGYMITLITKSHVAPINSLGFSYCVSLTALLQLLWPLYDPMNKLLSPPPESLPTLLSPAWKALATDFLTVNSFISLKSVQQSHFLRDAFSGCLT